MLWRQPQGAPSADVSLFHFSKSVYHANIFLLI
uniref:Uncharacterized protein n=1 Tax=Arundo donax TaxID=35708 RepID=A0A0A9EER1_ARUDO